jgi:hypothetical protein
LMITCIVSVVPGELEIPESPPLSSTATTRTLSGSLSISFVKRIKRYPLGSRPWRAKQHLAAAVVVAVAVGVEAVVVDQETRISDEVVEAAAVMAETPTAMAVAIPKAGRWPATGVPQVGVKVPSCTLLVQTTVVAAADHGKYVSLINLNRFFD